MKLDSNERARLRPIVVVISALCGLSSGAALVLSIVTDRPLSLTSTFVVVPALIAFVGMTVWFRREQQGLFMSRLRTGLLAGTLATAAYDIVRFALETTGLADTNTFRAIPVFGLGITGRPVTDPIAITAGWAFHLVNGLGFAIAYAFVAAGRRWWFGVMYALILEAFMIGLYPGWLGFTLDSEFLQVSILGHVAYGAILGRMVARAA